jgi:RNA polymerase sigma-70 factor (ECF subfamily)
VLDRARRRDPEALEAFFERYFEPVHALAYRLVGERAVAEDLAQEVFLKVHRALDTLDAGRDPWPWLATIVHNACRDLWRSGAYRMGRRSDSLEDDTARAERIPSGSATPESQVLASERERLVREAIDQLPESLRETVLLYDYQGLNHLEVARMLGIEHAAARKRYSRALDALGKLLHESVGR